MALIWGIPYLFIKIAVTELSPASLVLFRTAIGTVLLLPLAAARKDLAPVLKQWKWILVYTAAEVAAPWLLLSDAEQRISSSLAGLLLAATPSFGAILAWATGGHDRLDRRRIIGLAIGFVGVGALVGLDIRTNDVGAIGEALLVALGYAIGATIISRKLSTLPSLGVVVASLAITALVYAPIGIAQLPPSLPAPSVVFAVAVLGVVCTAIAFIVFFALIREVGSARATVITYLNPAVALALGIAVLGEPVTLGIVTGFVLIVLGSVLATRRGAATPFHFGRPSSPRLRVYFKRPALSGDSSRVSTWSDSSPWADRSSRNVHSQAPSYVPSCGNAGRSATRSRWRRRSAISCRSCRSHRGGCGARAASRGVQRSRRGSATRSGKAGRLTR